MSTTCGRPQGEGGLAHLQTIYVVQQLPK